MKGKKAKVIDNRYFELVRRFPLKPLSSEEELDEATEIINSLIDRGIQKLTSGEDAYLDVLSDLTRKYEQEHHPIPDATAGEMLQFFLEDRKMSQRALAIGSGIAVSTISQIIAGDRQMNLSHMQKIAAFLNVPVAMFVPEPQGNRRKRG
jgi:HTH-type transcriptional regulator/antitoxin HigA